MSNYGRCPICGAHGASRERRPNGNDKCERGHTYPSANAVMSGMWIPYDEAADEEAKAKEAKQKREEYHPPDDLIDAAKKLAEAIDQTVYVTRLQSPRKPSRDYMWAITLGEKSDPWLSQRAVMPDGEVMFTDEYT